MKKAWKILAFTAAAASLIPFVHKKDEAADQETFQALLWKVVNRPDPDAEDKRKIEVTLGFNNPFSDPSAEPLFADDEEPDAPEASEAPGSEPPAPEASTPETSAPEAPIPPVE